MIELLKKLDVDITFSPDDGAFRSKLVETVIDNIDAECTELFSEDSCDIQVSITRQGEIRFRVISDLGEQDFECNLSSLNQYELSDFEEQLARQIAQHSPPSLTSASPKIVIRKSAGDMLGILDAAQKLGCSESFLKSKIPCTDYNYIEVDGKKEIKEYYWSINLIERLCHIKLHGAKTEDTKFIAEECCDGDYKWAEEILVLLGRPINTHKVESTSKKGLTKRPAKVISKRFTNPQSPQKKAP